MQLFGYLFVVSTTLLMLFKRESDQLDAANNLPLSNSDVKRLNIEDNLSVTGTYKLMWKLLSMVPVQQLVFILLTVKIGYATESMIGLKLIEYGVPREKLSLLAVPLSPLHVILPLFISKYSNGPEPLTLFMKAVPGR
jgi:PAT family acetyl-CoA transporter-like MFS transporter 1